MIHHPEIPKLWLTIFSADAIAIKHDDLSSMYLTHIANRESQGMVLSWQIRSAWVRTVGHVVRNDINQRLETREGDDAQWCRSPIIWKRSNAVPLLVQTRKEREKQFKSGAVLLYYICRGSE